MSMLQFVLSHVPDEWTDIPHYTTSYVLITLSKHDREYQIIEAYFSRNNINQIQRVQNPFQYGRFMLRKEMLETNYESIVFHPVHKDDVNIALRFNCDYRRYTRKNERIYEQGQHPKFYQSFTELLKFHCINDINVLVLKILTITPKTQCDYYIKYLVKFD